jgi:hypothetical protein
MRVPSAPAVRSKVDLQIEIVPADGTSAAKLRKRRLRYVAVSGQLSDKPMLVCVYLHEVSDRKHNRGRKINAQHKSGHPDRRAFEEMVMAQGLGDADR